MAITDPPVPSVEPIKVMGMVLQQEMDLPVTQILLGKENYKIPKVEGLYVALLYGPDTTIGNNNYNSTDAQGNFYEVQDAVMLHQIEIEIMSFDSEARLRKQEVLQALQSYYAQSLMEKYQMRIAATPTSFVPVDTIEETKQLNRFHVAVAVNAIWRKIKTTPYYETLQKVGLVENP